MMEEALGKAEVKKLKQDNGGKDPKVAVIREALFQFLNIRSLGN